jgi:hypothetical protein
VVDPERAAGLAESALDIHIAREEAGIVVFFVAGLSVDSIARCARSRAPICVDAVACIEFTGPTSSYDAGAAII